MDEAIEAYTKAIELIKDHIYYSNRSAAFLKKGNAENALMDAIACLEMNPEFCKGYSRKGAALYALKKYDDAMNAYEQGLAKFPNNIELIKAITKCKTAKEYSSDNQNKARQSKAAKRASISMQGKADSSETMSDFVLASKMALELEIKALKSQLELIHALATMTDEVKLAMLFGLVDKDHDGRINARELADALRKRNADLAFADSIVTSISIVASFDSDHDAMLDLQEFKAFLDAMLQVMGVTFHELAEFLILQNLYSDTGNDLVEELASELVIDDINEAVLVKEAFFNALTDPRMLVLFSLFDTDGSGSVDFKEVAIGMYQLTDDMEDATRTAIVVLIMLDEDDKRMLNYEEFANLMLHVVAAAGKKFDDMADKMTLAMVSEKEVSEDDIAHLMCAEVLYHMTKDEQEGQRELLEIIDTLQYGRMQKLFDLWDEDKDNEISFEELLNGMRKFNGAIDMEDSVAHAALAIIGFDADHNQTLNRVEFARALINYAAASEIAVHDLVDFMVVTAVIEDDSPEERAYMRGISSQATTEIKAVQDLLEVHGIE